MEKNSWIVVITTLITVGGTVAVAMINREPAKADKLVEEPVKPDPPVDLRDRPVPDDTTGRGGTPVNVVEPPAPVPTPAPAPTPVEKPATTGPTVDGAWHDYLHRDYVILVTGNVARLTGPEFPTGMPAMVSGNGIQWNFTMQNGNVGTCGGVVTGTQLNIMCNSLGGSFPFPLHRPGT